MGSLTEPLTHQLLTLAVQQALGLLLPPRPPPGLGSLVSNASLAFMWVLRIETWDHMLARQALCPHIHLPSPS